MKQVFALHLEKAIKNSKRLGWKMLKAKKKRIPNAMCIREFSGFQQALWSAKHSKIAFH